MMNNSTLVREAHEAFVTGHNGSAPHDIILAVYPAIPASITAAVAGQRFPGLFGLFLECILLVVPLTLSFTHLANYTLELSALMLATAGVAVFFISPNISHTIDNNQRRLKYLTSLRGQLNLVTVIAILAIDFRSFPRRFVKTEEYGYSLMDVGAAGFVINNGIVEGRKRPCYKAVVRDGAILTVLGFVRLLLIRASDYQHHVTEYGVHANFFFTLAFVKLTCSWWIWRLSCIQSMLCSILISVCHQVYLVYGNGAAWTLSDAPRDTLLSANREWVVALAGYASIYLIGAAIGDYIFNKSNYGPGRKSSSLLAITLVTVGILVGLHYFVGPPSRRLGNPTFIYFCVCFLLIVLTHYALIEDVFNSVLPGFHFVPITFHAVNQQPLIIFLLANLMTGIINKSINTLDVAYPQDLLIINGYTLGLVTLMLYLYSNNSKEKRL
ncbi:uncharacterized protein LOC135204793 [Macrobrachium nipponense]|uniref:uncharacterized protein LOC135204793 n=1 Tax=Macrobrachium nipponense TaxID=159736 RepID=UPI0030C8B1A4